VEDVGEGKDSVVVVVVVVIIVVCGGNCVIIPIVGFFGRYYLSGLVGGFVVLWIMGV